MSLSKIVQGVKRHAAREINRRRATRGSLWQAEGFDRIVRDEDEYREKANYIFNNAARAGLVQDAWEYDGLWWDSQAASDRAAE